jgi:hypothetical protein
VTGPSATRTGDAAPPDASKRADDRFASAGAVADAVLYEGYVLYPYRASSRKNQVRFQWGVLTPRAFSESDDSERWWARTECLVDPRGGGENADLHVRLRCLQTQRRRVEALVTDTEASFHPVAALEVDGTCHVEWDEAVDRVVDLLPLAVGRAGPGETELAFTFEGGTETQHLHAANGTLAGRFVRERLPVEGTVRVATAIVDASPYVKVTVTVENTTPWTGRGAHRSDVMAVSLVAAHTMLAVEGGRFVSLLDPPDAAVEAARTCHSEGCYPVLVGDETVVLASPIILYDHPEVAPQSPGDLYDGLEIDEILALRVMTLTDAEKSEARGTDPRAAAIIERCDSLSPEVLGRLHGEMRPVEPEWVTLSTPVAEETGPWWDPAVDASVDPWNDTVCVDGVELGQGSPVRLHPSGRSDAQDMFLDGHRATVAGVFADVDGGLHLAVTLDDDPTAGALVWPGRYLYFHPDEVEPLDERGQRS